MTGHLPSQGVGDLPGQYGDVPVLGATRPIDGHVVLRDDASGTAGQQDDPVTQTDGLTHVVGDEQDG